MYITVDALDFAGKSTQINLIEDYLIKTCGIHKDNILRVREPGGNYNAELIRDLILHGKWESPIQSSTEILLMFASRIEMHQTTIANFVKEREALGMTKDEYVILGDRSFISSYGYQATTDNNLASIHALVSNTDIMKPDISIILTITIEEMIKRSAGTAKDNIESRSNKYFREVQERMVNLSQCYWVGMDVRIVNGVQSIAGVHSNIVDILEECL